MFAFTAGKPAVSLRAPFARTAAFAAFLALTGCASTQATQSQNIGAMRVAQAAVAVEVEDDGLPTQSPPSMRIHAIPDDPSEPFSPNYGGANPSAFPSRERASRAPVPQRVPDMPDDLPPAFRQKLVSAIRTTIEFHHLEIKSHGGLTKLCS